MKIRHYGLVANHGREARLTECRRLVWALAVGRPVGSGRVEEPPSEPYQVCGGVV